MFNLTGDNYTIVEEGFESLGAIIEGRRMFDLTEGWQGSYPVPNIPLIVLAHDPPRTVSRGATSFAFVTDDIERGRSAQAVT